MDDKAPIIPFDWQRLLIGEDPWGFYFEIAFRSVVMYIVLLLLLRVLSKRALTQLSILEFGIVISLGSAAGDPTFYKEIPLLQGILVLAVVICVQMGYTWLLGNNEAFETAMEGKPVELVRDGRLISGSLKQARISQSELFELLRHEGIQQLGELHLAYLEQNGQLSLFCYDQPRHGLAIVPPWELQEPDSYEPGKRLEHPQTLACSSCGLTRDLPAGEIPSCQDCDDSKYMLAQIDPLGLGMKPGKGS
jgi:uncharacterized membrane protein YcaP (DUF421 family)